MPSAPETHDLDTAGFRAAILDPAREKPAMVAGPRGKQAVKRFNVYRNNVTVSLINALADIFPAVQRITGETLFRDMARAFVRANPPSSPLLFLYGGEFPAFIEGFEHARRMPYLADVARLERAWLTAYHAADLPALQAQSLAAIPPEDLADTVFAPHPAAGLVRSRHAVFDIFDTNRHHEKIRPIDTARAQDALVARPGIDVTVTALPEGHGAFFEALLAGETLGAAAEAGAKCADTFDINEAIGGLLSTGAFLAVKTD
ncbi:DNA-binding domain-containing protein [Oricola sp.]|uniref:HvfC/BufC N-terminal domain-containing protein n=1 Tax=Oricola sp. TaxID=1979950 RepID=UPI0025F70428|nr:DNA-binding domain-containing protein [Oricola sp.]MCI5074696.1 DNA-binding domain-containing protein [Oricola sp.]